MPELILITSLKILFVYAAMQEGNVLFWLRRIIDWMIEPLPPTVFLYARKPLYECLFCMSSVWGLIFTIEVASFTWQYLTLLFAVAGFNYLIQAAFFKEEKDETLEIAVKVDSFNSNQMVLPAMVLGAHGGIWEKGKDGNFRPVDVRFKNEELFVLSENEMKERLRAGTFKSYTVEGEA